MVLAAEYKDEDTADHIARMSRYCALIAEKLGLPTKEVHNILYAAPTLLIGIKRMLDVGDGQADWQIIMAAFILAMIPPVFVVIFMQKQFVRGMTETEK